MRRLALSLALAGCSRPAPPLDVGYHGSDRGLTQATAAAAYWRAACGVELVAVHRGEGDVSLIEEDGMPGGDAYGITVRERPVLSTAGPEEPVRIKFTRGDTAPETLAHEFGHALGLEHETTGIMRPGQEWAYLDPDDSTRLVPGLISPEDCSAVR